MELRHYWSIVRRSWPVIVGLPLLVAGLTLALALALPRSYVAKTAMLVTQRPIMDRQPAALLPDQDNYYSWVASEYALDDLLQIVQTERFAEDIITWVVREHPDADKRFFDPIKLPKLIKSERKHRTLYLTINGPTANDAIWTAEGAAAMLREKGLAYWQRDKLGTNLDVSVLDPARKAIPLKGIAAIAFDVVLRSLLALLLAVGIAFLRHYLDQTLRHPPDVENLGLNILGTIPVEATRKR
ncbi:MAG: hypothetical protein NVS2B7_33480 [Herpetosiphon sp.]